MENKTKIAVKVNGGFGTVLVRANYLHCLYQYLNDENVEIYAYGHKSSAMNDAIFKGQPSIYWYGVENEWNLIRQEEYDVVFVLDMYPELKYAKNNIRNKNLADIVEIWRNFQSNIENKLYYNNLRKSKPYVYTRLIIEQKTVLNSPDIDGVLGIGNEYDMPVVVGADTNEVLEKFGLKDKKFITIQRGINPKLGTNETPKMWPLHYYDELVLMLKKAYPQYTIVQLGESSDHCKAIDGIDISLLGQTSWDDLKILLKHATLHIDGECGMVHLRKALHAGPSVVIFGSTPIEFFGYTGNINIKSDACSHWCAELREDWEYHCLKDVKEAPCMYAITPQIVFEKIQTYLNGSKADVFSRDEDETPGSVTKEIIEKYGKRLDEQYVKDWLSTEEYWGYELVDMQVKDLLCTVYDGQVWNPVPVKETPAYQYLCDNKNAYQENMEIRNRDLENNQHSVERYEKRVQTLEKDGFDEEKLILVGCNNVIKDGQHRAAIWMKKYGENSQIPVLRVYKSEL